MNRARHRVFSNINAVITYTRFKLSPSFFFLTCILFVFVFFSINHAHESDFTCHSSVPITGVSESRNLADNSDVCGPKSPYEEYYNAEYFKWQIKHQEYQAKHSNPTRGGRIKPEFTVLEIGCSAGAVLNTLQCLRKYCVEINANARKYASKKYGIETFRCVAELPDDSVDYAYSVAVLEHVEAPILLLRQLYSKMRLNSSLEIQVKNEGRQSASSYSSLQLWSHKKYDMNNHIYTWTALLLGNMIEGAGFQIIHISSRIAAFPNNYEELSERMTAVEWAKVLEAEGKKQGVEVLTAYAKKL